MMSLTRLFDKIPTLAEMRMNLKEIDREQRKKLREMEMLEQKKQRKVQEAVGARKAGKQDLVRDIFRELRQLEIDRANVNVDLRRLSLTKTALTSMERKLDMLERKKDRESMQNLIARFNQGSIQKAIDSAEADEDAFNALLNETLGETGVAATENKIAEDAGFADFDRVIGEMAKSEATGSTARGDSLTARGSGNSGGYGDKPVGDSRAIKPEDWSCNAACPVCITVCCALDPEHWGRHRCSIGHSWV